VGSILRTAGKQTITCANKLRSYDTRLKSRHVNGEKAMMTTYSYKENAFYLMMENGESWLSMSFSGDDRQIQVSGNFLKGAGDYHDIDKIVYSDGDITVSFVRSFYPRTMIFANASQKCFDDFLVFMLDKFEENKTIIDMSADVLK
jgi:hypothetical protein